MKQKIILSSAEPTIAVMSTEYETDDIIEILSIISAMTYFIDANLALTTEQVVYILEKLYNFECSQYIERDYGIECYCVKCDETCSCECHYGLFSKSLNGQKEPIKYNKLPDTKQKYNCHIEFDMEDIRLAMHGITLESAHNLKEKWLCNGIYEVIKSHSDGMHRIWFPKEEVNNDF